MPENLTESKACWVLQNALGASTPNDLLRTTTETLLRLVMRQGFQPSTIHTITISIICNSQTMLLGGARWYGL